MVVKPNANVPYNRLNDCLNFVTEITGAEFAQQAAFYTLENSKYDCVFKRKKNGLAIFVYKMQASLLEHISKKKKKKKYYLENLGNFVYVEILRDFVSYCMSRVSLLAKMF